MQPAPNEEETQQKYDDINRSKEATNTIISFSALVHEAVYEDTIGHFNNIAKKAGANFGAATETQERLVWRAFTHELHEVVDMMAENMNGEIYVLYYDFGVTHQLLKDFLAKEFRAAAASSAKTTFVDHRWKKWGMAAANVKDRSAHWVAMVNQVEGFHQLEF